MNEELEHLFEPLKRDVALSDAEKTRMRGSLLALIDEHPAQMPFFARFRASITAPRYSHRWASGAIAAILILILGTGTTYAAGNSLPGQPLYPIKVNVEEPIEGALQSSPQAKADWQTTLTDRRLQEAEQLAADNDLTPSDTQTIQNEINSETQGFNTAVSQLAQSTTTAPQAVVAQSGMEASLDAHEEIIDALTASSTASSTRPQLFAILGTVHQHEMMAMRERIQTEIALASSSPSVQSADTADATLAEQQLQSVQQLIAAAVSRHNASTTIEQALSVASDTQATISVADNDARHGQYGRAFGGFLSALRATQEASIDVTAAVNLNAPISISVSTSTDVTINATSTATTTSGDSTGD